MLDVFFSVVENEVGILLTALIKIGVVGLVLFGGSLLEDIKEFFKSNTTKRQREIAMEITKEVIASLLSEYEERIEYSKELVITKVDKKLEKLNIKLDSEDILDIVHKTIQENDINIKIVGDK